MIARVTRGKYGFSEYLRTGRRADSKYTRDEKDKVTHIYGDFTTFNKTENFLNATKNYVDSYLHITLSFNKDDVDMLENLSENEREILLKDLTADYIKHYVSGYDIDSEVIAYAEMHEPKIQNENDKERLPHIHLGIMLWNPKTDKKIRQSFANLKIDSAFQTYTNQKYNLTQPRDYERKGENKELKGVAWWRDFLKSVLKEVKSEQELIDTLQKRNFKYRKVETKRNQYYKITLDNDMQINLRGRGFENLDFWNDKPRVKRVDTQAEREQILKDHYAWREEYISKFKKEPAPSTNSDKNEILSYQQKIFYKHYKQNLDKEYLQRFFINDKKNNNVNFTQKALNIDITDKGDRITSNTKSADLKSEVELMLKIAQAKGWNLQTLEITGSAEFKSECERQIREIIESKSRAREAIKEQPRTPIKSSIEKMTESQNADFYKNDIEKIKQNLSAEACLDFAVRLYGAKADNYEIIDNKINNKTNRQKPKNPIDFLQKELHIDIKSAVKICKELLESQKQEADKEYLKKVQAEQKAREERRAQRRAEAEKIEAKARETQKPQEPTEIPAPAPAPAPQEPKSQEPAQPQPQKSAVFDSDLFASFQQAQADFDRMQELSEDDYESESEEYEDYEYQAPQEPSAPEPPAPAPEAEKRAETAEAEAKATSNIDNILAKVAESAAEQKARVSQSAETYQKTNANASKIDFNQKNDSPPTQSEKNENLSDSNDSKPTTIKKAGRGRH